MVHAICLPCYTESKPFRGITKDGLRFKRWIKNGAVFTAFYKGSFPVESEVDTQAIDEAMTSFASWEQNL